MFRHKYTNVLLTPWNVIPDPLATDSTEETFLQEECFFGTTRYDVFNNHKMVYNQSQKCIWWQYLWLNFDLCIFSIVVEFGFNGIRCLYENVLMHLLLIINNALIIVHYALIFYLRR